MALKITNNYGVYELEGNVEGTNTMSLKHHFEQLMSSSEKIILSLEKVKRIDAHGIQVLTNLYRKAIKKNKIFYMIGSENHMITKAFGKVNYMIRKDFV
ncbi:STAS domain-containing protein [Aquimarina amphilecti]|uniref:STAS domain-containing protein n=1 Tax=Aquimarina amphilecti TaxID=1038014 RepID=A0A1H7S297_AQUAM|nr:STAS domain-containing protein [Aquimarina amphilecti]SEL66436.1 STAS domain-containing protein [Aquimarina amphilecti]